MKNAASIRATVAVSAVLLTGCGTGEPSSTSATTGPAMRRENAAVPKRPAAPAQAQRVAMAYVRAARLTTPRTLRARNRRQQHLAVPQLARSLARFAPTAGDVDQAVIDNARRTGQVTARTSVRRTATRATVTVTTREQTTLDDAGELVASRVEVTRTPAGWRVAAYTVLPTPNEVSNEP